jgi:transketolase
MLIRQPLPTLDRRRYASAEGVARGGYILADGKGNLPQVILIGTGSEVSLCLAACEQLRGEGITARVVSMTSWELFDRQDAAYRERVLPRAVSARVAVEAGSSSGWSRYVGIDGAIIAMDGFGASAPAKDLLRHFGFTVEHVVGAAREQIATVAGRMR